MQRLYQAPNTQVISNQRRQGWSVAVDSIPSLTPPFQSGEYVRPRAPWHPWRLYPIRVGGCRLIGDYWLIEVHVKDDRIHNAKVLADDYEPVKKPVFLSDRVTL